MIPAIVKYFTKRKKKKATPFRYGIVNKEHKPGLSPEYGVEYKNKTLEGEERVLIGYKLNKLSYMY
jgi:hypothetical protein